MKIKMIRTMTAIFDFHPEYYPEGTTPEEAMKMDCDNTDGWEDMFNCELLNDSVEGQLIDDNDNVVRTYIHSEFENTN